MVSARRPRRERRFHLTILALTPAILNRARTCHLSTLVRFSTPPTISSSRGAFLIEKPIARIRAVSAVCRHSKTYIFPRGNTHGRWRSGDCGLQSCALIRKLARSVDSQPVLRKQQPTGRNASRSENQREDSGFSCCIVHNRLCF